MPTTSKYPSLERAPGKADNWVEQTGGLPAFIDKIARTLHNERGMTIGRAIATAVEACRKWAAGGGGVNPDTRAKAVKALAEWEAKKARAKATRDLSAPYDVDTLDLSSSTGSGIVWIDLALVDDDEWDLIDLAPGDHRPPYHWKHGYIPVTPAAALSQAKGNRVRAAKLLAKGQGISPGDAARKVKGMPTTKSRRKIAGERRRTPAATTPMTPAPSKAADDAARGRSSAAEPSAADLSWAAEEWKRRNPGKAIGQGNGNAEVMALARTRAQGKADRGEPATSPDEAASERARVAESTRRAADPLSGPKPTPEEKGAARRTLERRYGRQMVTQDMVDRLAQGLAERRAGGSAPKAGSADTPAPAAPSVEEAREADNKRRAAGQRIGSEAFPGWAADGITADGRWQVVRQKSGGSSGRTTGWAVEARTARNDPGYAHRARSKAEAEAWVKDRYEGSDGAATTEAQAAGRSAGGSSTGQSTRPAAGAGAGDGGTGSRRGGAPSMMRDSNVITAVTRPQSEEQRQKVREGVAKSDAERLKRFTEAHPVGSRVEAGENRGTVVGHSATAGFKVRWDSTGRESFVKDGVSREEKPAPEQKPATINAATARRMSDEQLERATSRLAAEGGWGTPAMAVLEAELERRDDADRQRKARESSPKARTR